MKIRRDVMSGEHAAHCPRRIRATAYSTDDSCRVRSSVTYLAQMRLLHCCLHPVVTPQRRMTATAHAAQLNRGNQEEITRIPWYLLRGLCRWLYLPRCYFFSVGRSVPRPLVFFLHCCTGCRVKKGPRSRLFSVSAFRMGFSWFWQEQNGFVYPFRTAVPFGDKTT